MASKTVAEFAARTAIGPFGSRMKSDLYTDSGVPVIRGTNLTGGKVLSGDWVYVSDKTADDLSNCCVYPGDLVFPHRGAIGEVGIVPDQFPRYVMSSSLMTLSCDRSKAHPDYVYYFFKSATGRHELLKNASQVGTPGIGQPLSTLRAIEVPLPPPSSQRVIAHALGDLDSKIDLNRRINQTLEAMAQAIFKSWFVDFDPVKVKIAAIVEGRDPLRAAMSAISGKPHAELDTLPREHYDQLAATAALFPDEMEESELGEIPRGWRIARIQDVVEGLYDGPHATPAEATEGAVFLGIRNMTGTSLDLSDTRLIAEADWRQWTRRVEPRAGDIVFSYEATLGYFALLPSGLRCCLGRRLALIRPRVERGFGSFWFHQFVAPPFQHFLKKHTIPGATVNRIALKEFPSFTILEPATSVQSAFCEKADPIWSLIHANQAQSERLAKLRDTLLPKLLSGELSVTELDSNSSEVSP